MTENLSPRDVRDLAEEGRITPEQAGQMFQLIRSNRPDIGDMQIKQKRFTFNQKAPPGYYHEIRKEKERKARHIVGTPVYIAAGMADGIMDGIIYLAGELAEDISFGISRTKKRVKDGWERGKSE